MRLHKNRHSCLGLRAYYRRLSTIKIEIKTDGFGALNCCETFVKKNSENIKHFLGVNVKNCKINAFWKNNVYVRFRRIRSAKIDSNTISEHRKTDKIFVYNFICN